MGSARALTGPASRVRAGLGVVRIHAGEAVGLLVTFVATTFAALAALAVVAHALPGWSSTIVSSGSMAPRIRLGDVVVYSPSDPPDIGVGSVVVFRRDDGEQLVHRVVTTHPDGSLTTRGDANPTPDPGRVPPERVRGRGFVLIPWVGYPRVWLMRGEYGPLVIAGAVALSGIVAGRWSSRRARSGPPARPGSPVRWLLAAPPECAGLLDHDSRSRIVGIARACS